MLFSNQKDIWIYLGDLGFRDALHQRLEHYIQTVPKGDFDKFLGDKSRSLEEQLEDIQELLMF